MQDLFQAVLGTLAVLQQIVDHAPRKSEYAMKALMWQATVATYYKITAAPGYVNEFQKRWPRERKFLESLKKDLQMKQKERT